MRSRTVGLAAGLALVFWQLASAQDQFIPSIIGSTDIRFVPDRGQGRGIAGEQSVRGRFYVRLDGRGWVPVELTNGGGAQLRPLSP
jgi:hypothetical protein